MEYSIKTAKLQYNIEAKNPSESFGESLKSWSVAVFGLLCILILVISTIAALQTRNPNNGSLLPKVLNCATLPSLTSLYSRLKPKAETFGALLPWYPTYSTTRPQLTNPQVFLE